MKKVVLTLLMQITGVFIFVYGQNLTNTNSQLVNGNIQTPNSSSLGKYGNSHVNLFRGQPDISVPLFDVNYGGINVPIAIQYDASGIKTTQFPSWVGLGWSLNVGGIITRQVKDLPDDYLYPETSYFGNDFGGTAQGYYFRGKILNSGTWNSLDSMQIKAIPFYDWPQTNHPNPHYLADGVPDDFSFHFGNYSGSFFVDEKGDFHVKSDNILGLKIIPKLNGTPFLFYQLGNMKMLIPKLFTGFDIITPDGTTYEFGGNAESIEFSRAILDDFWGADDNTWKDGISKQDVYNITPTAWHITKIIKPDGKQIDFAYVRGQSLMRISRSIQANLFSNAYTSQSQNNRENVFCTIITPSYLTEISTPIQTLTFYRSFAEQEVYDWHFVNWFHIVGAQTNMDGSTSGGDEVSSKIGVLERQLFSEKNYTTGQRGWPDFNDLQMYSLFSNASGKNIGSADDDVSIPDYSYELDSITIANNSTNSPYRTIVFNYTHDTDLRLFLNSISTIGKNRENGATYRFKYIHPELVPNYNVLQIDQWGYYNGINYANVGNKYNVDLWRLPNETMAQYGTLYQIEYPTGGVTRFQYELNNYSKYQNITLTNANGSTGSVSLATCPNTDAGGLRIKEIFDSAGAGAPVITKQYFYVNNYVGGGSGSSGILSAKSKYLEKMVFLNYCYVNYNHSMLWSDNAFSPYGSNENTVTYSEVTEKSSDGSASAYKFTNFDSPGGLDEFNLPPLLLGVQESDVYQLTSNDLERGLLLSKTDYNSAGNRVHDQVYTYKYYQDRKLQFAKAIGRLNNTKEVLNPSIYWWYRICMEANVFRLYPFKKYYYHIPLETISENYYDGDIIASSQTTFTYDENGNIVDKAIKTSDHKILTEITRFNSNSAYLSGVVTSVAAKALRKLYTQYNILNYPVEVTTTIEPDPAFGTTTPDQKMITGSTLYEYYLNKPTVSAVYNLELTNPLPYYVSSAGGYTPNFISSMIINGNLIRDSRYKLENTVTPYTNNNDGKPATVVTTNTPVAFTWDCLGEEMTSVTQSASNFEVAFSGFEGKSTYLPYNSDDDNKGNWNFSPTDVSISTSFTGQNSLQLVSNGPLGVSAGVTSVNSIPSGSHVNLAFWAKGMAPLVKQGTATLPMYSAVKTIGNWNLFVYPITGNNTKISIISKPTTAPMTQTTAYIDEVRLVPQEASMKTYTYEGSTGNLKAVGDENSSYVFYEYDGLGRLIQIKNEDGQVLKKYTYHYRPQ